MTEAKEECIHHWILEAPNGVTSKGTCKKCGSEQDFYNAPEYMRESGNPWMRNARAAAAIQKAKLGKEKAQAMLAFEERLGTAKAGAI